MVLSAEQRTLLERTVIQARRAAEAGAANALRVLAVEHHEPYGHMTPAQRELRNKLRARGRLLGDVRQAGGAQATDCLAYELAYEYWHRMLFARFLDANGLLMYEEGVEITLDDCEELAREEGHADKWVAAAVYASRMLPGVFRPDDPLLQLDFAPNDRIRLEQFLAALPIEIFRADDALGWVYQFWQSEEKERINKSEAKIDGARLPAVTQLFTEPYMVDFLLHNTIGAWWVSRHPGQPLPLALPYLRRLPAAEGGPDDPQGAPAAGTFAGWPNAYADLTVLDPCMGSGHFVAAAFQLLARLRMHDENLTAAEATERVIRQNLHGLELDARCTQIAAFNLALTAWKFIGKYHDLPPLNLACCGVAPVGSSADWERLADPNDQRQRNAMKLLFQLFRKAPELGSLLEPETVLDNSMAASIDELLPVLDRAIKLERTRKHNTEQEEEQAERGVVARGIAFAAKILTQKYTLLITNVPYLKRGKQAKGIADYTALHYPASKGDLATVFLERMLKAAQPGGLACSVMPQNWLFLNTYKKIREALIEDSIWSFVIWLGEHAFENQAAAGAFAAMVGLTNSTPSADEHFLGIDVSAQRGQTPIYAAEKATRLISNELALLSQRGQLTNPDTRIVYKSIDSKPLLRSITKSIIGLSTGDDPRFTRKFWEIKEVTNSGWELHQSTPSPGDLWTGYNSIVFFENGKGELRAFSKSRTVDKHRDMQGQFAWNKSGLAVGMVGRFPVSYYFGSKFDSNISVIVPEVSSHLPAIWAFCSSPLFGEEVRKIDQKLNVTNATLVKVPFDLDHWQKVAAEQYPNGLPKPYSDDPTQWLFHGHPRYSTAPLQVAVARLLGYRWPAEIDTEMELADEARAHIAAIRAIDASLPVDAQPDADGIVCLPACNQELPAAERLRAYLQAVWGPDYTPTTEATLLAATGTKHATLETWLHSGAFWEQHLGTFQQRPFVWHVWDGRRAGDGFSALVHYHRFGQEALQKLIYTYLADWIRQCEHRVKHNHPAAAEQLNAARQLDTRLKAILEGEAPYDIFVRWKTLAQQPIGWNPDLNDGVRLNIRPFVEADVLRKKPGIKWDKDRGKNPVNSPWGPERYNDLHLSLAEKRAAQLATPYVHLSAQPSTLA